MCPGSDDETLDMVMPLLEKVAAKGYVNEGNNPISRSRFRLCTILSVVGVAVQILKPDYGPTQCLRHFADLNSSLCRANGKPCVGRAGTGGAGHYVKMIHNGIEHGMMSAISEAWGNVIGSK